MTESNMRPLRITVIFKKDCPHCEKILPVLFYLQALYPHKIVIHVRETTTNREFRNFPFIPGGVYHTQYGGTPEVIIGDHAVFFQKITKESIKKMVKDIVSRIDTSSGSSQGNKIRLLLLKKFIDELPF